MPDAWIDHSKTKVGYEIPLNRHFYLYEPPRPLEIIEGEIKDLEKEILEMLKEATELLPIPTYRDSQESVRRVHRRRPGCWRIRAGFHCRKSGDE